MKNSATGTPILDDALAADRQHEEADEDRRRHVDADARHRHGPHRDAADQPHIEQARHQHRQHPAEGPRRHERLAVARPDDGGDENDQAGDAQDNGHPEREVAGRRPHPLLPAEAHPDGVGDDDGGTAQQQQGNDDLHRFVGDQGRAFGPSAILLMHP
jgi:hypothetical protein